MVIVNDLRPVFPFVTRIDGFKAQIKPFASYYQWLDWFDFEALNPIPYVDALTVVIEGVNDTALAAAAAAALAAADASTAQAAADAAQSDVNALVVGFADNHFLLPQSTHTILGGFGNFIISTVSALNGVSLMQGLNSEVSFKVGLIAGNYTFKINGTRLASGANCSLYVDGTLHSMNHFYGAPTINNTNVFYVVNGLSVGVHTFGLKITGRQPGNTTGYDLYFSHITISPNP